MRNTLFYLICLLLCVGTLAGQQATEWQIHEGNEGVVNFRTSSHGDPAAYSKMTIPSPNDGNWEAAPTNEAGEVHISRSSTLRCKQQLDFLYFQTEVDIPAGMQIEEFNVSYKKADDGARIYFFNSKHPNGHFNPDADLVLGGSIGSVNLKEEVVAGEVNRVVIVQYDNCASGNNISGISMKLNGKEVETTDAILDLCGNEYSTVRYGNQIWLQENLRAPACSACPELEQVTFGNHPSKNREIYTFDKPIYGHYGNNPDDKDPYTDKNLGAVFNYAAIEACNVCPEGFRIPTKRDWETLMTNVERTVELKTRNPENDNKAFMYIAGRFDAYGSVVRGRFTQFWTLETIESDTNKANTFVIDNKGAARVSPDDKRLGLYVRCVKSAVPEIPTKFKLHAYSTNGNQGNSDHWMGWMTNNPWANILTNASADNANIMNIKQVVADDVKDIVYLQVENYPGGDDLYYLTVDPNDAYKVKIVKGKSQWGKFRIKPSLQTETPDSDYVSFESVEKANFYLRHQGYKMYLHEATPANMKNKVYIEDASWLFQEISK